MNHCMFVVLKKMHIHIKVQCTLACVFRRKRERKVVNECAGLILMLSLEEYFLYYCADAPLISALTFSLRILLICTHRHTDSVVFSLHRHPPFPPLHNFAL